MEKKRMGKKMKEQLKNTFLYNWLTNEQIQNVIKFFEPTGEVKYFEEDNILVQLHYLEKEKKIYNIGDIHGSLQGFLDVIHKLKDEGVIDDEFNITGDNILIFTGDIIDYNLNN